MDCLMKLLLSLADVQSCTLPSKMPSHLNSSQSSVNVGEMVTFSCDEGYFIAGSGGLICMVNQMWNGALPTCVQTPSEWGTLYPIHPIHCTTTAYILVFMLA